MNLASLRPARDFAVNYGVKSIVYGPPGKGKTPLIGTCPRPVLLACEPGLLSMRGSDVPTWIAFTADKIDEFFRWAFHSNETKSFDTICVDSVSQMAEIYLQRATKDNKHGLAAYGQMARDTFQQLEGLYYLQQKHTYLIAKQEIINENGMTLRRPYFPGKELMVKVPHLYDVVTQLDTHNIPGVGQQIAFRCIGSIDTVARNRTGTLAEFEPPSFSQLVNKAMQ